MNYFQPHCLSPDETIIAAWDSQVADAAETPWLAAALAAESSELFPRFAACYAQLRALPRGSRRALQRQLARSREDTAVPPTWQRTLATSLAGAALLLALAQGAQAATITVTTNNPNIDDGDGKCSLIEAIVNANDDFATHPDCAAGNGADTIVLPKKTITLTDIDNSTYDPTGLPVITTEITIEGNGGKIIRAKSTPAAPVPVFRLLVVSASGDLTVNRVTLSNGESNNGGGVFNYGSVTIRNSTISGNGGSGAANSGFLHIQDSVISENRGGYSHDGQYDIGVGGGVANFGTMYIDNSVFSRNVAAWAGGGLHNNTDGSVTITSSSFLANKSIYSDSSGGFGGAISNYGGIAIERTTISGNAATRDGGGLDNTGGIVTIVESTISGNSVNDPSHSYGLAGGVYNSGTLTIENSTISGNTAYKGGGVYNFSDYAVINGSTISGNIADFGAGIYNSTGAITVSDSTISGNTAVVGGGIYNFAYGNYSSVLRLNRSLISGNKAAVAPEIGRHGYVYADNFNLFGHNDDAGVVGFTPGPSDIVPSVKPNKIIGPLKNNGGPTKTHALVKGSPAIDAIPSSDPACTGTDQRGVVRPQGLGCDIGAFER